MLRLAARYQLQTFCRAVSLRSSVLLAAQDESASSGAEEGETKEQRPSGWNPPSAVAAAPGDRDTLPYRVSRTKQNNLPVYLDYKHGRAHTVTIVRKIDGDVTRMERDLRAHLTAVSASEEGGGEKRRRRRKLSLLTVVDDVTGVIKLHGDYREAVKTWLKKTGF